MSSWSKQMLEGLTRFYHEDREGGSEYRWTRFSDDPIEVSLSVSSDKKATGEIRLRAYLVDNQYPGVYTGNKCRNLRNLVRRMDILKSRGHEEGEPKPFYRGVEVEYIRNIGAEEDIARLVEDFTSLL